MNVKKMNVKTDEMDRKLMQMLQDEFPLVRNPWNVLAKHLGISPEEVLERTRRFYESGILRKIYPVLNKSKFSDCESTLIAMRVPKERMMEVAAIINEYKTVTHNYEREHDFNLWFTITACGKGNLERDVNEIIRRTGIPEKDILNLPTTRVFKIDVRFHFIKNENALNVSEGAPPVPNALTAGDDVSESTMDEKDKKIIRAIEDGIPLVEYPFDAVAAHIGISAEEILSRLRKLINQRIIRRFGGSFDQRKVGIVANAVIAWKVPRDRVEEVGVNLSCFRGVTHCYEREIVPGKWEYNLFTVVHGYDRESVEKYAKMLSEAVGVDDYVVMFSSHQFKRASIGTPH